MARPEDTESAELNVVRDELRHAARQVDVATNLLINAVEKAERMLRRAPGAHSGAIPLTTPATRSEPVRIRE